MSYRSLSMSGKSNKVIILGDVHFGTKRFSLSFLENQLKFFNEDMFPYMEANNITDIYQLGDIFDNRTTADIIWLDALKKGFFDVLKEKGFTVWTLMGNHDIALKETRDISLIESISEIYPDNFKLFKERTTIDLCNRKTYIVPWIVKGEVLTAEEIKDKEIILGHFEIRNFTMVKGYVDTKSELTEEFFKKDTSVDQVFSGHYHIKNTYGDIKYLGTPHQLNWNDFNEEKGFYVWDGFDLEFHENKASYKHIKVKYNDETGAKGSIEVEGLFKNAKIYTDEEFELLLPELSKHEIKFLINKAKDRHFDEILYRMKESDVEPSCIIDNQQISEIIGTDYMSKFDDNDISVEIENTRELILKTVQDYNQDLTPIILQVLTEIDSSKKE
jgi:DNA repair exonuclease SbcCD nuclease subunit